MDKATFLQNNIINLKEKGRGFALRSVPLALSLSPLPGPFSHKKGGLLAKIENIADG